VIVVDNAFPPCLDQTLLPDVTENKITFYDTDYVSLFLAAVEACGSSFTI